MAMLQLFIHNGLVGILVIAALADTIHRISFMMAMIRKNLTKDIDLNQFCNYSSR